MKITKQKLQQIIKEELENVREFTDKQMNQRVGVNRDWEGKLEPKEVAPESSSYQEPDRSDSRSIFAGVLTGIGVAASTAFAAAAASAGVLSSPLVAVPLALMAAGIGSAALLKRYDEKTVEAAATALEELEPQQKAEIAQAVKAKGPAAEEELLKEHKNYMRTSRFNRKKQMKITKLKLQQIIKEEFESIVSEGPAVPDADPEVIAALAADLSKNPKVMDFVKQASQKPEVIEIASNLLPQISESDVDFKASTAAGFGGGFLGFVSLLLSNPGNAESLLTGVQSLAPTGHPEIAALVGASSLVSLALSALLGYEAVKNRK